MRLARFLAMAGLSSRRKAEELIQAGKIIINGVKCTAVPTIVDPDKDTITFKGKVLRLKKNIYLALNKPVGYVCTANDPYEKQTIYKLLPRKERLFSVGRLDKNSEGLLLVTNDGDFANKMMHPSYELEKVYKVSVSGHIMTRQVNDVVNNGIEHDGIMYKVKSIQIKNRRQSGGQLIFTLTEGKKREVRKICAALKLSIRQLKRTQVGSIKLADLPVGSWRELKDFEINDLLKLSRRSDSKKKS